MASDGHSQLERKAYRNRKVVECSFGQLKEYRRNAICYDKTARNYLAMVKVGCNRIFYKASCNSETRPSSTRTVSMLLLGKCL